MEKITCLKLDFCICSKVLRWLLVTAPLSPLASRTIPWCYLQSLAYVQAPVLKHGEAEYECGC